MKSYINKIKDIRWDNRVQRPGFIQSKQIVALAVCKKINITPTISVQEMNNIWINTSALYSDSFTGNLFTNIFPKAFSENKYWSVEIVKSLESVEGQIRLFITNNQNINWKIATIESKKEYLNKYVYLLQEVEKYYAFAVPLTNYCEKVLKENNESLLEFAVQYKELDVDRLNKSLLKIKEIQKAGGNTQECIDEHIREFAWIKTNYNIVEKYSESDINNELKSDIHPFVTREIPKDDFHHIVTSLQVGIYLRNRMKELSQQLWFYYDNFAEQVANDLVISKNDYLQLTYKEVQDSLDKRVLAVDKDKIIQRHKGFIVGVLDSEEILYVGEEVDDLFHYYNQFSDNGITEFKGNVACKGIIKGVVKVVQNISDLHKLNENEILVTSMTTPDFIIGMKIASAFITDEGGLSCHAAIVARELKKPCIIGTKIATKVLKDGDLVEVDANSGVVKIIKKA